MTGKWPGGLAYEKDLFRTAVAPAFIVLGTFLAGGCGSDLSSLPSAANAPPAAATTGGSRDLLSLADVERDSGGNVVSLTLFGKQLANPELQQLADLDHLQALVLQECTVSDVGLKVLGQIPNLKTLKLIRVPVSDQVFHHLAENRSLDELQLAHTSGTGSGLSSLADSPVTRLSIHSLTVTPDGMAAVTKLTALHELVLQCPQMRLEQLPALAPLAQLVALDVSRMPLGKDGMERLRELNRLQKLSVNSPEVDDRAISVLNGFQELQELELINSSVTDGGLSKLSLPNLRKLSLAGCTQITDTGLESLSGLGKLEMLDLVASAVAGRDLSPLGRILGLRTILISAEQFKGNDETIRALKRLLPECEVVIMRG